MSNRRNGSGDGDVYRREQEHCERRFWGLLFSVGGLVTPLWIGDSVGFGVGAFAGVKYHSLGAKNGSVSMTRFPLGAALHVLLHIDDRWWLFFREGSRRSTASTFQAAAIWLPTPI